MIALLLVILEALGKAALVVSGLAACGVLQVLALVATVVAWMAAYEPFDVDFYPPL